MTTTQRHHRRLAVGLVTAAVAAGVPSLAAASVPPSEGDEAVVTLVDAGDPNHQVLLGGPVAAGTVAESTTNYDVEMSMVASGLPVNIDFAATSDSTQTIEVLSVGADGAYTTRQTITSFDYAVTTGDGTPTRLRRAEHGRRLGQRLHAARRSPPPR